MGISDIISKFCQNSMKFGAFFALAYTVFYVFSILISGSAFDLGRYLMMVFFILFFFSIIFLFWKMRRNVSEDAQGYLQTYRDFALRHSLAMSEKKITGGLDDLDCLVGTIGGRKARLWLDYEMSNHTSRYGAGIKPGKTHLLAEVSCNPQEAFYSIAAGLEASLSPETKAFMSKYSPTVSCALGILKTNLTYPEFIPPTQLVTLLESYYAFIVEVAQAAERGKIVVV